MRNLARLLVFVVGGYFFVVLGMRVYVETYAQAPIEGPVSAIVVLSSGPVRSDQTGRSEVRTRVGADLYFTLIEAGDDPKLVLSGGKGEYEKTSKAEGMKNIAISEGVPPDAILIEGRSDSTLQNALFSRQVLELDPPGRIAVVTDRFHIPRAWASFRWAGMSDLVMVSADGEDEQVDWDNLMGEGIKWPANTLRGAAFSALVAVGWAQEDLYWIIK